MGSEEVPFMYHRPSIRDWHDEVAWHWKLQVVRRTLFLQIHRPRQRPITHHSRLLLLTSDDISPPLTIHNPFADLLLRLASISASSIVQVQVLMSLCD